MAPRTPLRVPHEDCPDPARAIALQLLWLAAAGSAAAVGSALAWHHPLWPAMALCLFVAWVAVCAWRPAAWLVLLPAALPLANLAPWTGWIAFDEFDLLVLGALAGGYLRWAIDARRSVEPSDLPLAPPGVVLWLALALAVSSGLGLYRGLADAGTAFGWFQGPAEALNSLRLFKAPMQALLMWPLLLGQLRLGEDRAVHRLGLGMVAGLGVVCLAVLWERAAYPGLWDFSQPYRTAALFWEMHFGGAAIDAYLALAMPFAAWALWRARTPTRWAAAALLALLAAYACLTTFSRGTYLAVGLSLSTLGLWLLGLRLGFHARALLRRALTYAASVAGAAMAAWVALEFFGLAGGVALLLGLAALLLMFKRRLAGWRGAAGLGLALALTLEVVAVFGTGNFMFNRLATSERDFGSRLAHWQHGLGLLQSPADWLWGIGLGRFPASYARAVPGREFSGAVQWLTLADGHRVARLQGPKSQFDLGGLFALTQRVPLMAGARYRVALDARVLEPIELGFSVCEMHLLYERRCQVQTLKAMPGPGAWQHISLRLRGPPLRAGDGFAPRRAVFALTPITPGATVDLRNLQLLAGAEPDNLLRNGDFARQGARWLPAAQHYFVPWHIDNLYLEWLIERGLFGLSVFVALCAAALHNLVAGPGRCSREAPFLAASLLGVLILGLVSSLMDVPRVSFMFMLLAMLSLSLRGTSARKGPPEVAYLGRRSANDTAKPPITNNETMSQVIG